MKIQENKVAASYLRGKATMTPGAFGKLPDKLKARAFTAARLDDLAQLRRIQDLVAQIPEGADWKKTRNKIAAEIGDVEGAKARAQLIMRVNAMEAYAVGRYAAAVEASDAFPFWMYQTMDDGKERAEHKALNGKVLPWDDPFWDTHYPPWDWGCRCMVIKLTKSQGEEKGIADSKALPGPSQNGFSFSPKDLTIDMDELTKDLPPDQKNDVLNAFEKTSVAFTDGTTKTLTELNAAGFAPAISMEDAGRFITNAISAKTNIPKNFKDLETLNRLNESLAATMKKLGIPKFYEFSIRKHKTNIASVAYMGRLTSITFDPVKMAKIKEVYERNAKNSVDSGRPRFLAMKDAETAFQHIIDHELGHVVFNLSKLQFKYTTLKEVYNRAVSSGDIDKISGYAKSQRSGSEFFAETFAMYQRGDTLPDYVEAIIKEVSNDLHN